MIQFSSKLIKLRRTQPFVQFNASYYGQIQYRQNADNFQLKTWISDEKGFCISAVCQTLSIILFCMIWRQLWKKCSQDELNNKHLVQDGFQSLFQQQLVQIAVVNSNIHNSFYFNIILFLQGNTNIHHQKLFTVQHGQFRSNQMYQNVELKHFFSR